MKDIFVSIRVCLATILICAAIYPLLVLGTAAMVAPDARVGSLLKRDGMPIGSLFIAQRFEKPEYFWGRPSAVDYNASAGGGSNLSPKNPEITKRASGIVDRLSLAAGEVVPTDLVLASGSGLDPHITQAAAILQARRIAGARRLSFEQVRELVLAKSNTPILGGEPIVNVLELNVALDALSQ